MAFCAQCGNEVEEGSSFCTACGAAVELDGDLRVEPRRDAPASQTSDSVSPLRELPASAESVEQPKPESEDGGSGKMASAIDGTADAIGKGSEKRELVFSRKTALVAAVVGIIAIVAVAVGCLFAFGMSGKEEPGSSFEAKGGFVEMPTPDVGNVDLSQSYLTKMPQVERISYPNMAFSYPADWSLASESLYDGKESVSVESDGGKASVTFNAGSGYPAVARAPIAVSVDKLAASSFVPGLAQSADHRGMGPFMVAKVGVETMMGASDRYVFYCYAVLPESVLDDPGKIDVSMGGVPGFDYSRMTQFYATVPEGGFSAEEEKQVIAVLASLHIATAEEVDELEGDVLLDDYVLPDSSTRLYSASELTGLSDYELFIARNEIFARHGRSFQKEELRQHFGSKPWYDATISPSDFSDSVLSSTEKKNIETIKGIEEARHSVYLLP